MPSARYSFRDSTIYAGIASQQLFESRRRERASRRERVRAHARSQQPVTASLPPPLAEDVVMFDDDVEMDFVEAEAAPHEASPASPRAVDAAEAMMDLALVQPMFTPPPPPPQPSATATATAENASRAVEAAEAMLGLSNLASVWVPPAVPPATEATPPSPRAMEAAEGLVGLLGNPQFPTSLPPLSSPRLISAAETLVNLLLESPGSPMIPALPPSGDADDEDPVGVFRSILNSDTDEVRVFKRQFLDTNMPVLPYNTGMLARIGEDFDGCAICTSELVVGQTPVRILNCNHAFCQPCIDEWLVEQGKGDCPLCRDFVFRPAALA